MEYSFEEYQGATIALSSYNGERAELHAIIRPDSKILGFESQIETILEAIKRIIREAPEILRDSYTQIAPVFIRWFLSDAANQECSLRLHTRDIRCAQSVIQQPPLDGSKVTCWVIFRECNSPELVMSETEPGIWENGIGELWAGDYPEDDFKSPDNPLRSAYNLTSHYLVRLNDILKSRGGSMDVNCLRTWYMVRDIDVNYHDVSEARNDRFREFGMTPSTHFIASTGINGVSGDPNKKLAFTAFADLSVTPDRIRFLQGPTHFNRTSRYGVAFERGTVVEYPDHKKVYISGTASINNKGEIMYPRDVERQTDRMLENIEVLLKEAGADWNDVAHFLVYLRDISDYKTVAKIFRRRFPKIPTIFLQAPVCRPGWLVETECMAITPLNP